MTVDAEALFAAHHHRLFKYFCRAVGRADTARDLDGNASLDIYGLIAWPEPGAIGVSLQTRVRRGDYGPFRTVTSAIQLNPEETVEIRLPKFDDSAGPFAKREFSIRIRARQLR